MLRIKCLSLAVLSYLTFTQLPRAAAQAEAPHWELIEEDEGIRVWSLDIEGRDLPGFRGITTIDAGIDDVDIGGNVPNFAARRYARNLPFETLRKLRSVVKAQSAPS